MVYVAAPLVLGEGDRGRLESLTRSSSAPAGLVKRARIVLLAADGLPNTEIAVVGGGSRAAGGSWRGGGGGGGVGGVAGATVVSWRERYERAGMAGFGDQKGSGRPAEVDEIDVVVATLSNGGRPPAGLGVTHWSSRLLARHLGTSFSTVARIWRKWDIQPHRVETFKFSTDPRLEAKIRDVVGLYLDPPLGAVVVSVDEKSQIQALDRTQPILPVMPGVPERQTHDYKRNGTTTLFAALEVATGKISADACYQRHRNTEFLKFLKLVAKAHPRVKLHVIVDNYATHKHPNIKT